MPVAIEHHIADDKQSSVLKGRHFQFHSLSPFSRVPVPSTGLMFRRDAADNNIGYRIRYRTFTVWRGLHGQLCYNTVGNSLP